MARSSDPKKLSLWQGRFRRFLDSGLAVARFCAIEHVSESSFYYWQKKVGTRALRRPTRAEGRDAYSEDHGVFRPVTVVPAGCGVLVRLPGGTRIEVGAEHLDAIGSRSCTSTAAVIGTGRHTAHETDNRILRYAWHPRHGQEFLVRSYSRGGVRIAGCHLPGRKHGINLPAWMFDPVRCSQMWLAEQPSVSWHALVELKSLLYDIERTRSLAQQVQDGPESLKPLGEAHASQSHKRSERTTGVAPSTTAPPVVERSGFERMVAEVCLAKVGVVDTLLVDQEAVYDARQSNDRLLLGLKGSLNEYELDLFRQRSQKARQQKALRAELGMNVPVGFVNAGEGRQEKNPDQRVQQAIHSIFEKFLELGTTRQVMMWFLDRGLRDGAAGGAHQTGGVGRRHRRHGRHAGHADLAGNDSQARPG